MHKLRLKRPRPDSMHQARPQKLRSKLCARHLISWLHHHYHLHHILPGLPRFLFADTVANLQNAEEGPRACLMKSGRSFAGSAHTREGMMPSGPSTSCVISASTRCLPRSAFSQEALMFRAGSAPSQSSVRPFGMAQKTKSFSRIRPLEFHLITISKLPSR